MSSFIKKPDKVLLEKLYEAVKKYDYFELDHCQSSCNKIFCTLCCDGNGCDEDKCKHNKRAVKKRLLKYARMI
jgi:hypothetical protein